MQLTFGSSFILRAWQWLRSDEEPSHINVWYNVIHFQNTDRHCYVRYVPNKHTPLHSSTFTFAFSCYSYIFSYHVFLDNLNYRYSLTTLIEVATYTVLYHDFTAKYKIRGFESSLGPFLHSNLKPMHHQQKILKHIRDGSKVSNNGKH